MGFGVPVSYRVDVSEAPHRERMAQLLAGIVRAEERQAMPDLPVVSPGDEANVLALDDLISEDLVRSDIAKKTGGNLYFIIRGLRPTEKGRRWLEEYEKPELEIEPVALTPEQLQLVETAVSQLIRVLESDEISDRVRSVLETQQRLLSDAGRGANDRSLVKRSLELARFALASISSNVAANVIVQQAFPVLDSAVRSFAR